MQHREFKVRNTNSDVQFFWKNLPSIKKYWGYLKINFNMASNTLFKIYYFVHHNNTQFVWINLNFALIWMIKKIKNMLTSFFISIQEHNRAREIIAEGGEFLYFDLEPSVLLSDCLRTSSGAADLGSEFSISLVSSCSKVNWTKSVLSARNSIK